MDKKFQGEHLIDTPGTSQGNFKGQFLDCHAHMPF